MRHDATRKLLAGCLFAMLLAACAAPATKDAPRAAAGATTGVLAGAPYRIDVPEAWNGELVMYLHGYEAKGSPRPAQIDADDFGRWLTSKGYAVAQSSYSSQGWAVAEAMVDNERLRQHFVARYGKPRRTLLIGHSMGGHLVLATLEAHPKDYDGALALCGANAPAAELFADAVVEPLVAFDHYFPGALGLAAGGLADPASPPLVKTEALEATLHGNEPRAEVLTKHFDIPRGRLADALMFRYLILREIMQRAGGFPFDNRGVVYSGFDDDAAYNAGVRRYAGDPGALAYVRQHANLTGRTRDPVVLLSNRVDPIVTARFSSRYIALAKAAGRDEDVLALPSVGVGHCAFTPEDVDKAFGVLETWVDSGKRPALP